MLLSVISVLLLFSANSYYYAAVTLSSGVLEAHSLTSCLGALGVTIIPMRKVM